MVKNKQQELKVKVAGVNVAPKEDTQDWEKDE